MAGDVYSAPPYVGRGGWSWYTGSAGWLHRAAVESMFGMRQHGDEIEFFPCLPSAWPECELTLRRNGKRIRIVFAEAGGEAPDPQAAGAPARPLRPGERIRCASLEDDALFVMTVRGPSSGALLQRQPSRSDAITTA